MIRFIMAKQSIRVAIKYKSTSYMIKAAIKAGLKHIGGNGFLCKNCGDKRSAHKFTKGRGTVYGCNLCGARWGSLIKEAPTEASHKYSELKVMSSNGGYYIGREDDEDGSPYSKESGYYKSYGEAKDALENDFEVRDCAENNYAYDSGALPDIRK